MSHLFGKISFLVAFVLFASGSLDSVHALSPAVCSSLASHPLIGASQGYVTTPAESLCFASHLPAAGVWLIDAGSDTNADFDPRLDLAGTACDPVMASRSWRVLGRSADSAVVEIDAAGDYTFCVASRDPAATAGVRIRTSFASYQVPGTIDATCTDPNGCPPPPPEYNPEHEPDPDPFWVAAGTFDSTCTDPDPANCPPPEYNPEHEPDPDPFWVAGGLDTTCEDPNGCPPPPEYNPEHEPDPDPFRWVDAPCLPTAARTVATFDAECTDPNGCPPPEYNPEHEPDPDPFWVAAGAFNSTCTDPDPANCPPPEYNPEHEPDPDPVVLAASCRQAETLWRACQRLQVDDHADLEVCASPLRQGTVAHGAVAMGDVDVFRVDVTAWATLRLAIEGPASGVVYNRQGHRLGSVDDLGQASLVEMFGPGAYFVHVQGQGRYRLAAERVDGPVARLAAF